ncbi:MAG TPA: LD-carboxypeptidase [Bacteroidales bacterium]|nr:LD-carboxypeptidase [Bacteroidales bacterium]
MIAPKPLQPNDLVWLVSPAGVIDSALVEGAANTLMNWGLKVKTGVSATAIYGRFAGETEARLHDLQVALDDPECRAIFCTRGGYGSIQLVDKLSLEGFGKHPKWLIGFSDITLLHCLLQINGYASIHGGMAKRLAQGDVTGLFPTEQQPLVLLRQLLSGERPPLTLPAHPLNRAGHAVGQLRGGNLSILLSLRGTPLDNIPAGSLLFLEDVGEKPYAIDRMMHNLKFGGVLARLGGLMVGQFSGYEEDPLMHKTVYELIADTVADYTYPVCFDLPVGHTDRNIPLLCGQPVTLSIDETGAYMQYLTE